MDDKYYLKKGMYQGTGVKLKDEGLGFIFMVFLGFFFTNRSRF